MQRLAQKYKTYVINREFLRAFATSVGLLTISLVANYYATAYASERASNAVSDIILSNIPLFNVDVVFIFGPLVFWAIIAAVCIYEPRKIPFMLKSVGIFVIVRSLFISLTHIGPYPDHIVTDLGGLMLMHTWKLGNFLTFSSGGDLFFSSHTGLPFLMALVFWKDLPVRIFCLGSAVFFAVVVLLGHLHYSIDVASAFFITYTIYHIAERLFPEDRHLFYAEHPGYAQGASLDSVVK